MKLVIAFIVVLAGCSLAVRAPAPVDRGRYLVEGLAACGNCHTPKGPAGNLPGKHLAGGFEITEAFGVAVASNITPDRETGIGAWSDDEIVRAIVAYLRSIPPVANRVTRSRFQIALPPAWGPPVTSVPDVPTGDRVRYGAYLAGPVAHCVECHSPAGANGMADLTQLGAGGLAFRGPWGVSYAANITSDPETGLGRWNDSEIVASIHGARRGGGRVLPPMPVDYYVSGISAGDLEALVAYLRSIPPIRNAVPRPEPPKR